MEISRGRTAEQRRAARAAKTAPGPAADEGVLALAATTAAVVAVAVLIRLAFPDRSDYAGHFLAGAGATVMLMAVVSAFVQRSRPGLVVLLTLLAVALGTGTEATIFREAAFDWVDFAIQSSGAALVANAFLRDGDRHSDLGLGLGFVLLVGGFWFAFG